MKKNKSKAKDRSLSTDEFVFNPFTELQFQGNNEPLDRPSETSEEKHPEELLQPERNAASKSVLYIRLSKKGRGGKTVTVISNFNPAGLNSISDLTRQLRKVLGTGGTCSKEAIELQGDRRSAAAEWFQRQGFKLKGEVR